MAANPRDIIIRPIVTEKTSDMMKDNKYTFQVAMGANKTKSAKPLKPSSMSRLLTSTLSALKARKNVWADLKVSVPITRKQL